MLRSSGSSGIQVERFALYGLPSSHYLSAVFGTPEVASEMARLRGQLQTSVVSCAERQVFAKYNDSTDGRKSRLADEALSSCWQSYSAKASVSSNDADVFAFQLRDADYMSHPVLKVSSLHSHGPPLFKQLGSLRYSHTFAFLLVFLFPPWSGYLRTPWDCCLCLGDSSLIPFSSA